MSSKEAELRRFVKQELSGLSPYLGEGLEAASDWVELDIIAAEAKFVPKHPPKRSPRWFETNRSNSAKGHTRKEHTTEMLASKPNLRARMLEQDERFDRLKRGGRLTTQWRRYGSRRGL
ncbi:MAG: hypothetical protein HYU48_00365 [Candidatus Levybacteria bacterium]|nr:hypothetical protein [Candidatus Levybacteria bacterium]